MNISFFTLGCKVNQYESQVLRSVFGTAGHSFVEPCAQSDVIIVNSCTVTAESDRKTGQAVRRMRRLSPSACIVLTGCMPQAFPEKAQAITAADIVTGNRDNFRIPQLVDMWMKKRERIVDINLHIPGEKISDPAVTDFHERTRAFIKIEDGCDRYCTYCIIPKARGRVRSKSPQAIFSEAAQLVGRGYKELVLVGINLSDYGKDLGLNLCDAVSSAAASGAERIRLGSLEPDQITDEMIERLLSVRGFCPQFHLSLQSGCDATLRHMNRHYDTAFYSDLVHRLRKGFINCSVTTDVMVGFAGETDEDFRKSVDFVRATGFAKSHIFVYSRRCGTPAAEYPDQVDEHTKHDRSCIMAEAAAQSERAFLLSQVGRRVMVLFESRTAVGLHEGYSENYTLIRVNTQRDVSGKILPVIITGAYDDHCVGEIGE